MSNQLEELIQKCAKTCCEELHAHYKQKLEQKFNSKMEKVEQKFEI